MTDVVLRSATVARHRASEPVVSLAWKLVGVSVLVVSGWAALLAAVVVTPMAPAPVGLAVTLLALLSGLWAIHERWRAEVARAEVRALRR